MNTTRNKRRLLLNAGTASLLGTVAQPAMSQRILQPGRNYTKLSHPQRTHAPAGKIEVIEFFWVGCPHCRALEPVILNWEKTLPPDVMIRKVHVNFRVPSHQQMYYTLETLKQADQLIHDVFAEIHDRRNGLRTPDAVFDWAQSKGIDRELFKKTYKSFGVRTRMTRASQQVTAYGVSSVPTMAVNGQFVTSPSMAGSNQAAMQVVNALISEVRERG